MRLLIAFTGWVWLHNAWALDRVMQLDLSILLTKYVVLFYLMYRLVDSPHMLNNVLFVHVWVVFSWGGSPTTPRMPGGSTAWAGPVSARPMRSPCTSRPVCSRAAYLILHPGRWWVRHRLLSPCRSCST